MRYVLVQNSQVAAVDADADVAEWQTARYTCWQVVIQTHLPQFHKTRVVLVSSVNYVTLIVEEV